MLWGGGTRCVAAAAALRGGVDKHIGQACAEEVPEAVNDASLQLGYRLSCCVWVGGDAIRVEGNKLKRGNLELKWAA